MNRYATVYYSILVNSFSVYRNIPKVFISIDLCTLRIGKYLSQMFFYKDVCNYLIIAYQMYKSA